MLNAKQYATVRYAIKDVQWYALHEDKYRADELFAQSNRASFCESLLEDELDREQRIELVRRSYNTTTEEPVGGNEVGLLIAAHHFCVCLHNAAMKKQTAPLTKEG
jgi:hypothetical protein